MSQDRGWAYENHAFRWPTAEEWQTVQRRYQLLTVTPNVMAGCLGVLLAPGETMDVPVVEGDAVPEGVLVGGVFYDAIQELFFFKIHHPSFAEVEEGARAPYLAVRPQIARSLDRPVKGDDGIYRQRPQNGRRWL